MKKEKPALLQGGAMRSYIEKYLDKMKQEDICAMFRVEFDHSSGEQKKAGELEEVFGEAGQMLSSLFRATDLVGQTETHAFVVFLTGGITAEAIQEKARLLCEKLQFAVEGRPDVYLTVCVGVYLASGAGLDCASLYEKAEKALWEARKNGRGSFYIYSDLPMDKALRAAYQPENTIQLHTLLKYMDGGVCLLEAGEKPRLIYASHGFYQMTGRREEDCPLPCTLDRIGIHPDYEADYEQTLREGAKKGDVVSHVHRISGNGRDYIWRQIRAVRLIYPESREPVMLEVSTDISELVEKSRQLRESNERLRVAFEQTPHVLWEVDVEKRTFAVYNVSTQTCDAQKKVPGFPEDMIESGVIHPDSAVNFRIFAEELLEGSKAASANFIMRDGKNGCYEWVALSYRMVYDMDGKPVKAIGVEEKLPGISGIHTMVTPRRPLPEILRHHLLARVRADLTADFVADVWLHGIDRTAWTWGKSYTEILDSDDSDLFIRGEGLEFHERYLRENLLKAFEQGERWSSREHRVVDSGGNIRWMTDTLNLQRDPQTKDVYMFACFMDTQERHDWESLLEEGIEREGPGLPYTPQTMEKLCKKLIVKGAGTRCAVALIKLVGDMESLGGGEKAPGLRTLDFLAVSLSFALGTDCVIGWHKRNELLVFFPKGGSRFELKRRIEDAFAYARVSLADIPEIEKLRFVAGVAGGRTGEADYRVLTLQAGYLCELWENSAMDAVVFPNENEDWAWTNLQREGQKVSLEKKEQDRLLTREEQTVVLNCVTLMLTSSSLEESVGGALQRIGEYYQADRTYLLSLSEESQEIRMLHEWTGREKHSIRQVVSGMKLSRIPLLVRCMEEQKPVCVESQGNAIEKSKLNDTWRFMAFPLENENRTRGFLCVENAKKHEEDTALLHTLVPYIEKEHGRFRTQKGKSGDYRDEALNRLPNLRSYMNVVYSLNSDLYSSMGALALDIPNFSGLNSSFGFEYGRELLNYIAGTLGGVFGKSFIFRTWDAEFVVLFPNTIQEVFTGRCTRLRTMLQRRYPHQIRMGSTWTDGIFSAKELVKEARTLMNCEHVKEIPSEREGFLDEIFAQEQKESPKERYLLYFQPKIDMRDGSLIGAEALARAVDKEGNIVPPARFIEVLEKNGDIRELDFFMLEAALKQLSKWKKAGLPDLNVSVNISRRTLFNPTTLASILAIQSHYPEIPPEQIELEITETAGDVEKATLADVVDSFGEYGIRFELDDFGSHYANMSMFSNIRFHTVKLDRSLINDLPENEISRMLVENIAKICSNFGINCVAEGVETQQQAAVLLKSGCIYGQGYYYDRPMPPQNFENKYLRAAQR